MTPEPPALFIADATGLDFLNSVATPVDVPVDWIRSGAGLVAWLDQARLVSRASLDEICQRALPGELDKPRHRPGARSARVVPVIRSEAHGRCTEYHGGQ